MSNSILDTAGLPRFGHLQAADVVPAMKTLISANQQKIEALLNIAEPSFESVVAPLEALNHTLQKAWSPVSHLQSVSADSAWREAHAEAIPLITDYATGLSQNEKLYAAYTHIRAALGTDAHGEKLSVLDHALRDFRKAGVGLDGDAKQRFRSVMSELASTATRYAQNVQDSTDAWKFHTEDESALGGLQSGLIRAAAERAERAGKSGFLLSLDMPTYQAVVTHADDSEVRRTFYEGWVTRASDKGPDASAHDNRPLMNKILAFRHEAANLVGFENYADYALDGRMAPSSEKVLEFLTDLAKKSRPKAEAEIADLEAYAGRKLDPWDLAYFSEKLKDEKFSVSDEKLRPYFPAPHVVAGLFTLASELYGISVAERADVATWHDSVCFYDVSDQSGQLLGSFFADLYAREGKRSGAWIDECIVRQSIDGHVDLPVGYLVCNFTAPENSQPSQLTHYEVVTLFHEFGHMLHHLLTKIAYPSIAGINGVPWDAVELPSQFMENFAWERRVLGLISRHVDTGESLSEELYSQLLASRQFNAATQMLRQIEFALFDFRLHAEYKPGNDGLVDQILAEVRAAVSLIDVPDWNRFANSFSHIFAGGYAAGYYSYKWAEVLAADAYTAFDSENGIDHAAANRFRESILEVGGSRDILDAFIEFRGREPSLAPLLAVSGIQ